MTIHRDGRQVMLECEECPETTELYADFEHMIAEAKKADWEITVVRGNWTHTCPGCKGGSKLARQRALFR